METKKSFISKFFPVFLVFALGVAVDRVVINLASHNNLGGLNKLLQANISESNNVSEESSETFLVTRVIDGDTIEIEGGEKVRYIGIDAPESVNPRKPVECFAKESSERNKKLVEGKRVRLVKDVSERDRYGRLLRYVYLGNDFINLNLIKNGYAIASTFPPDVKFSAVFTEAVRTARENKIGLWDKCDKPFEGDATPPPQPLSGKEINYIGENNACLIKGNINSQGEKIYHLPSCSYYAKTVINEKNGEKFFCNEKEAVIAGWRKAENCP